MKPVLRISVLLLGLVIWAACGESPTVPDGGPIAFVGWETIPRVVDPDGVGPVRIRAYFAGAVELSRMEIRGPGTPTLGLAPTGEVLNVRDRTVAVWEAETTPAVLFEKFTPFDGSNFLGRISVRTPTGLEFSRPINIVVRDGAPAVTVSRLSDRIQVTDHVVNIRTGPDGELIARPGSAGVDAWGDALSRLGLDPDFIAHVPAVTLLGTGRAFYAPVRNATEGIGRAPLDATRGEGSAYAALRTKESVQGVLVFRDATLFDLANGNAVHEIGHRFLVYAEEVYGDPGGAHWPISELAIGVMGYQLGDTSERFPFAFEEQDDGSFRLRSAERRDTFNSMELYFMGLIDPSEVGSFRVFRNPAQLPAPEAGAVIDAPSRILTVDSMIAELGPRVPAYPDAPSTFRVTTIVSSRDRFLTELELAHFERAALRGAATTPLPPLEEHSPAPMVTPFHVATGGRGRVVTRVR